MVQVGLEELELPVSEGTNRFCYSVVASPEARCRLVRQSFRERPAQ
jgi:hypothetical protein